MYSIHQFARLAGVTVKALRHYDRLGVLTPARTRARYRRYSVDDLARLDRVLALKTLGLSLAAIKRASKGTDLRLHSHREALERTRCRIDTAIAALRKIEQHQRPAEAIDEFVAEACWDRWEHERQKRASLAPRVPDRASESHRALFQAIESALVSGLETTRARELATRYRQSMDAESLAAVRNRATWPSGMRQWVASLYERTPEDWDRVLTFIEGV